MTDSKDMIIQNISQFPAGSLFHIKGTKGAGGTTYCGIIQKRSPEDTDYDCCVIKGAKVIAVEEYTAKAAKFIKDNTLTETIRFDKLVDAIYFICGRQDTKISAVMSLIDSNLKIVGNLLTIMMSPVGVSSYTRLNGEHTEESMSKIRQEIINRYGCENKEDTIVYIEDVQSKEEVTEVNEINNVAETEIENVVEVEIDNVAETETTSTESDILRYLDNVDPSILMGAIIKNTKKQLESTNTIVSLSDNTLESIERILKTAKQQSSKKQFNWGTSEEELIVNKVYGFNIEEAIEALKSKKALLLQGVPGTGKTIAMMKLIENIVGKDQEKYRIVSFGQNTSYSDFIGGLYSNNGIWEYRDGIFVDMCKKAFGDQSNTYILGIDEISRGNTEEILGEALTGLEARGRKITLGNGETLIVPSNLYVIGTMNITDRSTSSIDIATLQRFSVQKLTPQWENEGYIKEISCGNEEVALQLSAISNSMVKINKIIKEDKLLTDNNMVGTRCITINNATVELIKQSVKTNLRNTIEINIKNASTKTKESILDEFETLLDKLGIDY